MNLIFAEMLMAFYGVPVNFVASLQKGWKMGEGICQTFGFLITLQSKLKYLTIYLSLHPVIELSIEYIYGIANFLSFFQALFKYSHWQH